VKIVLPGGTGHVGRLLQRSLSEHEVVVLSRNPSAGEVEWDGRSLGAWAKQIDGADAVLNLAGRSVSCRYTDANLAQLMSSRVDAARIVGQAIALAARPPAVWLQMSTATIYADRRDAANDEATGVIGGQEPGVPDYWEFSVRIARQWEAAQHELDLTGTRRVALRSAMVMSPDHGSVFDVLSWMARVGLGGSVAGGGQYVSWIHGQDFVRSVEFLLDHDLEGPVNLAAPEPLPQRELMRSLRAAWGRRPGLPATAWMAELGAWVLRSDTELLLKSRRVVPGRLLDAGFVFEHPAWPEAAADLVRQRRSSRPAARDAGPA
jgi:uncharacterized protein (TIGR01777 family)